MKRYRVITGLVVVIGWIFALSWTLFRPEPAPVESGGNDVEDIPLPAAVSVNEKARQHSIVFSRDQSDDALMRHARELVRRSPEEAVVAALAENDFSFRERVLFAVLRAWGEQDPYAAVNWASIQEKEWRFKRMEAALTGAVAQPAAALQIGRKLLFDDAETGSAYCTALVGALSRAGEFQTAVQLAEEARPDARRQWLDLTFRRWAEEQPQEALNHWSSIEPDSVRDDVFRSLAAGWANRSPRGLAEHSLSLPAGDARAFAFTQAMEHWLDRDPVSMGEWLNGQPQSAEIDSAAALLVMRTDIMNRPTEVALGWVEHIQDADLRRAALDHVLREWARAGSTQWKKQLERLPWLTPAERNAVEARIEVEIASRPGDAE